MVKPSTEEVKSKAGGEDLGVIEEINFGGDERPQFADQIIRLNRQVEEQKYVKGNTTQNYSKNGRK